MNQKDYDVVVLGGSLAGIETALACAENGLKTAIVEENQMGGSLYRTSEKPIEILLKNNELLKECLDSTKNGLVFTNVSFDPDQFFDQIEKEADQLSQEKVDELKEKGVDIFVGYGSVRPDKTINIIREGANTRIITWKNLVYAGEPVSSIPPKIRKDATRYYTGSNIGLLDHVPNGLIIYGEGPKAVVIADIWSNLGCKVYLICPDKRLLKDVPDDVEKTVIEQLKAQGVKIYTDVDIIDVYQDSEFDVHFEIVNNETNEQTRLIGSELVVLTREGTSLVGIETLNIAQEDGWIKTDNKLETSFDDIYTWTGSKLSKRSTENDKAAAQYLGKLLSGKTDELFEFSEPEVYLKFHPDYARYGIVEEGDNIVKGVYKNGEEFLEIYVDKEFGEIVGIHTFHNRAKDLVEQLKFLMGLEISINDLVDLTSTNELNQIIIDAAEDAVKQI